LRIKYSSEARRDRRDAQSYYKRISPPLALAFTRDLQSALQYLIVNPLGAPVRVDDVRAKRLLHFPYTIFYRVHDRHVFVLTIAHQARDQEDLASRF
jgi:plasmid stabilization system protein ParE